MRVNVAPNEIEDSTKDNRQRDESGSIATRHHCVLVAAGAETSLKQKDNAFIDKVDH